MNEVEAEVSDLDLDSFSENKKPQRRVIFDYVAKTLQTAYKMKKLCLVCSFCLQDDWKQFMKLHAGRLIRIELLHTNVDYQQQTKVNYKQ